VLQGFRVLRIGLDPARPELYARINGRVQAMFDAGLVNETEQLLKKYRPSAGPLNSIGYKQVVQLLNSDLSRDAAITAVQQAHRNYAKRQMTWFRREPEVTWLSGFGDEGEIQQQAVALVENQN
jgi:tRNA dimethylallyltransferase